MRNFKYIILSVLMPAAAVLCSGGCRPMAETSQKSPFSIDASLLEDYPSQLDTLPIGVICTWADYAIVADEIINLDAFDNINGARGKDEILDFAGEHFSFAALRDSLQGNLRDTALAYACSLMKSRVKFIIIASQELSRAGLTAVQEALGSSGTGVKAVGVNDSLDCRSAASECYETIRSERNMALRITQQRTSLKVYPEECTARQ